MANVPKARAPFPLSWLFVSVVLVLGVLQLLEEPIQKSLLYCSMFRLFVNIVEIEFREIV